MNEITYNNKNLSDFGVYYDSHSSFGSPERDVELVEIAGKNGALIIDNDRYRNIDLTFPCYVHTNFLAQYRSVMAYLQSCKGYNRLEITQEPNHFRMASFNMGSQPTPNQFHRSGQFPLVFNCKPQRFLKSGETSTSVQSQSTTYTTNPININNTGSAVSSMVVDITPIQELHGFSNPWVGGSGKNKLKNSATSQTVQGINYTVHDDGSVTGSNLATGNANLWLAQPADLQTGVSYLASCKNASTQGLYMTLQIRGTTTRYVDISSNSDVSFTLASNEAAYVYLHTSNTSTAINTTVYPMIRLSTVADSSWEPYENICPITGTSDVTCIVAGKNLIPNAVTMEEWYVGSLASISNGIATLPGSSTSWESNVFTKKFPASYYDGVTTYTLSYEYKSTAACSLQIVIGSSDQSIDSQSWNRTRYTTWKTETVPSSSGAWTRRTVSSRTIAINQLTSGSGVVNSGYIQFYARTDGVTFQLRNVQMEVGNARTDFVPSVLNKTTTSLGTTVYGGTLNLTTGVLIVDKGMFVVSGGMSENSNWSNTSTIAVSGNVLSPVADSSNINTAISSTLVNAKTLGISTAVGGNSVTSPCFGLNSTQSNAGYLYLRLPKATCGSTASAVNTWLSSNPITVVYPLYSPQTYQLTPQQISLLAGINTLTVNGGMTTIVNSPSTLVNPTLFESKPLIRVYDAGTIAINNHYITVAENPFSYIDIDCELMDAYYGSSNANQYVTFSDNDTITLKSGNNYISTSRQIDITPRWYEI